MTNRAELDERGRSVVQAKIGDPKECLRTLSTAVAKRAYEIYERRGRGPGRECEDWRLAEKEVLRTLSCCGILDSKDQIDISLCCSALGLNSIEKVELCVEPHRLLFIGKKGSTSRGKEGVTVYRVLPLEEEVDPSTVHLIQNGGLLEIKIQKVHKELGALNRAA